jgi:aquaporin Z
MRAVNIKINRPGTGITSVSASFRSNRKYYVQEALGLGIFMVSACFFSGVLFGKNNHLFSQLSIPDRQIILGVMMGATALFIFYSPLTSPSGSHINPAVTLAFLRLGKIGQWDALFYVIFQFIGGTLAVYLMVLLMGENLTASPLHDVVTIPGKYGPIAAAFTELTMAFFMMSMILFTADHTTLSRYSRIFAGILVCIYVIVGGPVSGFGMNPARSFASALPADIWTAFWIYLFIPPTGMLAAAELYSYILSRKN